jgi:hypothetical protein
MRYQLRKSAGNFGGSQSSKSYKAAAAMIIESGVLYAFAQVRDADSDSTLEI